MDSAIAAYYGVLINRIFNQVPKTPKEPRVRNWALVTSTRTP